MLTVKYLAYGNNIGSISEIEVPELDTLIDLGKTIKNEDPLTFCDVNAKNQNLDLYGIPIPDSNEQFEEVLRHWTPTEESRLKEMLKPLSSQNLHDSLIIVDVPAKRSVNGPGMTLNFWVSDKNDYRTSQVFVWGKESISDLAELVKNDNLAYFGVVSQSSLIILKLSNPDRDDLDRKLKDWALNQMGQLDPRAKVSDVLSDKENVLVFVNDPPKRQPSIPDSELDEIGRARKKWIESYDRMFLPPQLPPIPFPTNFLSLQDGSMKCFEYRFQPAEGRFIYFGRVLGEKHKICVKFVQRYSREAHEACASLGCAPKLLGFETLAEGQWFMVVMELLDPAKYCRLLDGDAVTSQHLQTIRDCVERLHDRGYVHGDMRDVNIMLSKTNPRECMFLDFDWAGEKGKAQYPVNISKGWGLWRPDRVVGSGVILAEDDMAMVDELEKRWL